MDNKNIYEIIHSLEKNATRITSIVSLTKNEDPTRWAFSKEVIHKDMLTAIEELKTVWETFIEINERK